MEIHFWISSSTMLSVFLVCGHCTTHTMALQMPMMNPFPRNKSIIVLDNCSIHKTNALREILEGNRHRLLFLPPYSLDFNPIEESVSCGMSQHRYSSVSCSCKPSVKAWIRRHWLRVQEAESIDSVAIVNETPAIATVHTTEKPATAALGIGVPSLTRT